MKWLQVIHRQSQEIRLGVLDGATARILHRPRHGILTVLDWLRSTQDWAGCSDWVESTSADGYFQDVAWFSLLTGSDREYQLTVPVTPPEVWGCGVTYRRSADFREEGSGIYDHIYSAERPELFFKATASRCVGPGGRIGMRQDSTFTAAEPELALVLSNKGDILGYTLANDVSAWDIERQNPLYLPQSKIYRACFSFGPVIVTPDEVPDPYALNLTCRIERGGNGGKEIFCGSASTALLRRRFPELIACLMKSNDIDTGTVLSTGTGIVQPLSVTLEADDVVLIDCPELGTLSNAVVQV
jgi:2-dehydro-3-deoxy-D-arabinonate dehydratase